MKKIGSTAISQLIALLCALCLANNTYCQNNSTPPTAQPDQTFTVKSPNGKPFSYKIEKSEPQSDYTIIYLSYPSAVKTQFEPNNTIRARLFLPSNTEQTATKRPAVISLPILNGDENLNSMVCAFLAKRGIPAIMFTLPYYSDRGTKEIRKQLGTDPNLFIQSIEQTFADIKRTIDLLETRPEVDPKKIGITGISLGGILSASAAAIDDRLYKTAILLAGGDLMEIINHANETRPLRNTLQNLPETQKSALTKKLAEIDPLTLSPKLRDRAAKGRVLMLNAANDEVIPRQCTEKLADALGIKNNIIWFQGLGHYTALAELPRALHILADFFAEDLPPSLASTQHNHQQKQPSPIEIVAKLTRQLLTMFVMEPEQGKSHFLNIQLLATNKNDSIITGSAQFIAGTKGRFSLKFNNIPSIGSGGVGFDSTYPWLLTPNKLFIGSKPPFDNTNGLAYVDTYYSMRAKAFAGAVMSILLVPDIAKKWVNAEFENNQKNTITVKSSELSRIKGFIRIKLSRDGATPESFQFDFGDLRGTLNVYGWGENILLPENCFNPPDSKQITDVPQSDLNKMVGALFDFIGEMLDEQRPDNLKTNATPELVTKADNGHGALYLLGTKRILILDGTPQQMGEAHGSLAKDSVRKLVNRVLFGVGLADTFRSGEWFINVMDDIYKRTSPYIPKRFIDECYSLANAAKIPQRDALYANLFPERFHCSGVAVKGKASLNGQVLHARVLDYMRDIGLQNYAAVVVFIPNQKNAWITLGYSGFIGTVTAMNEKGVAIGEMGGRGEGLWDGMPMSLLLREVMENASTAEQAVQIIKNTPRTCEYYYVVSDKSGYIRALHCLPDKITILKPGEQHPLLPKIPEDTVLISGDQRAQTLSQRLIQYYGSIDPQKMIEIIKRPVAMKSNLHNAIFAPQTLDMWFADAGKTTPACDEPYYHINLNHLLTLYRQLKTAYKN
ncbi:MAG: C45 family autoproteolytic acyltransferase/hydrolase [Verrucomicrobiia bacterium]